MKMVAVAFVVTLILSMASGCAYFSAAVGVAKKRVADRLDSAMDRYCEADEETRERIRERLAETTDPNRIVIECAGDDSG